MKQIDINCDMGEGIGNEDSLLPFISSANIACGYHAGDEDKMRRIIDLCLQYDVAIGAHPSFPDKENFGRIAMKLPAGEIQSIVFSQLNLLNNLAIAAGGKLHHVKPHGALYNMAAKDPLLARVIADAVKAFDSSLIYYGLSGSLMLDEAKKDGLQIAHEVFADRTYQPDGSLTPRNTPGALLTNAEEVVLQVMQMISSDSVQAISGEEISIKADTICIHGDGLHAVEFARMINDRLHLEGIQIRKIERVQATL
ncbi:MAG: LamB/YcsF family protein [Ferruginibacter sp.]|nr:LamB/YcsF family protein [Ferruginibacter sp.]